MNEAYPIAGQLAGCAMPYELVSTEGGAAEAILREAV
jgi:hypothetical protein